MCPMERRPNERAMHETFLVIKAAPADMGSRPLNGPFVTPDITVGPDGRPRAVVWNLGTREVEGAVTEFATVPAGMPVRMENRKIIGYGNPANIAANSSVTVTCTTIWPRMSTADVLIVTVCHPELDPVKAPYDPMSDRHVGQMNYAWAGTFDGKCGGQFGSKVSLEIRPANKGLFRVRLFVAENGRLPSNPQIDRTMAPHHATFRWLEHYSFKREDWELAMQDNQRMSVRCKTRFTDDSGRPEQEITGMVERK